MIKIKYFKLSMLIKMRLYFIIQKMYDCLTVLFQFIIMEQEQIYFEKEDDFFSFKRLFNEAFPETSKRSKIINNISSDQILDFYFSSNGNNDFILTNDGIFKINENKDEPINLIKIDFEEEENTKIQQIIKSCNKNNAKITFCNGILYFLSIEEKVIHKILVCSPKDSITDDDRPKLKESKIKESKENEPISYKNTKKQQKRERKKLRRNHRKIIERFEENLENISINISENYPIVAMNIYDDYARILQHKTCNGNKTTFIFTNIDLSPNSRINFDIIEAFKQSENEKTISQTQIEIKIDNEKYKTTNACFSKDFIFFSLKDSSFEQAIPYKRLFSPFLLFPYSRF